MDNLIEEFLDVWNMNQNKIEQDCMLCGDSFQYCHPTEKDYSDWLKSRG